MLRGKVKSIDNSLEELLCIVEQIRLELWLWEHVVIFSCWDFTLCLILKRMEWNGKEIEKRYGRINVLDNGREDEIQGKSEGFGPK